MTTNPLLDRISSLYSGPALIARLLELLGYESHRDDAKACLVKYLKERTANVDLLAKLEAPLSPDLQEWASQASKESTAEIERLERNLQFYKAAKDHDNIINALWCLYRLYSESCGQHRPAMIKLAEINDLVSEPKDRMQVSIAIVTEGIYADALQQARSEAIRAISSKEADRFPSEFALLRSALGLVHIKQCQFFEAAQTLASIGKISDSPNLFSALDLARYTALSALASFDRQQLKQLLVNGDFQSMIEVCPESKLALHDFCTSKYFSALQRVHLISSYLIGDPYLSKSICSMAMSAIRDSALCLYIYPFRSVCLKEMSSVFHESIESIQSSLVRLIQKGRIQGKIDAQNKILYTAVSRQRQSAFESCNAVMNKFLTKGVAISLRIAQLRYNVIVGAKSST